MLIVDNNVSFLKSEWVNSDHQLKSSHCIKADEKKEYSCNAFNNFKTHAVTVWEEAEIT